MSDSIGQASRRCSARVSLQKKSAGCCMEANYRIDVYQALGLFYFQLSQSYGFILTKYKPDGLIRYVYDQ
jgi:hypothetical protein